VTCISTKIEDGGHFNPFDQNICRSKQDRKKTVRVLYIVLKVLSNEKIKKYIAISLLILVTGYTFAGKLQYLIS
jgi:transcriptional regulator of met regulon